MNFTVFIKTLLISSIFFSKKQQHFVERNLSLKISSTIKKIYFIFLVLYVQNPILLACHLLKFKKIKFQVMFFQEFSTFKMHLIILINFAKKFHHHLIFMTLQNFKKSLKNKNMCL